MNSWLVMLLDDASPVWIQDNATLEKRCQQWLALDRLAIDTEFIRTDTYYPLPGLIQLNTGADIFFIDPLTITVWKPFLEVLEQPTTIKILHSCSEDLEVFQLLTGGIPKPLFDTQVTAAFAGVGYAMGYQKLVKKLLDIDIPKDETRSDWRHRPLTDSQVSYAALDVIHLLEVHAMLEVMLGDKPAKDWAIEDCCSMKSNIFHNDPESAWKDVKRAWLLSPRQLAVLKALCIYREEASKKRNLPKNWVLPSASLWPLAHYQPERLELLAEITGVTASIVKNDGQMLLNIIQNALQTPEDQCPDSLPEPLPYVSKKHGKVIKAFLEQKAAVLEIPVEILLPSKARNPILRTWVSTGQFDLPDSLQGWRRDIIGKPLVAHLNNSINTEAAFK